MGQLAQRVLRLLKDKNYLKHSVKMTYGDCISYDQYLRFSREGFRDVVNINLWNSILNKYITDNILINMDVPQKQYDEVFKFLDAHNFIWGNGDLVYRFLNYLKTNNLGEIKTLYINQHTLRLTWSGNPVPHAISPSAFFSAMEALKRELNEHADELINL